MENIFKHRNIDETTDEFEDLEISACGSEELTITLLGSYIEDHTIGREAVIELISSLQKWVDSKEEE